LVILQIQETTSAGKDPLLYIQTHTHIHTHHIHTDPTKSVEVYTPFTKWALH